MATEMPNEMQLVARFIRDKRKKIGLTQEELAAKAGVGLRFVRELERAKPTLRCDRVNQVLAMFGAQLGPVPVEKGGLRD